MIERMYTLIRMKVLLMMVVVVMSMYYPYDSQAINIPWTQAAWYLLKSTGNGWFTRDPITYHGKFFDMVSSGSIEFNSFHANASARHEVDITNKHHSIWIWAQTPPINWPGKMTIIVTNPRGKDVISKTVTHNQMIRLHSGIYGKYMVRFVQNSHQKWDCWIKKEHGLEREPPEYKFRKRVGVEELILGIPSKKGKYNHLDEPSLSTCCLNM